MATLDNIKKIKELDTVNVLGSIEKLGGQFKQAWEETKKINFSENYKNAKNLIMVGMGGSALGPHIIKNLYTHELVVPFEIINNYHLPNYAGSDTFCVLSSYSGTTEEILHAGKEATERQALIAGITVGGNLAIFLKDHDFPSYIFEPKNNPSDQPRMGLGYSIAGILGMLNQAGFLNIEDSEMSEAIKTLEKANEKYGADIPTKKNLAKQIAEKLKNKIIILIASEFLAGNTHTMANQINESAKQFACSFELPEINHHLMEGLKLPESNSKNFKFLFFKSKLYSHRVLERYPITEKVIGQNNIEYLEFVPESESKLAQALETLVFGSYIGFYLAMLNGINPSEIPFVKFFKEELKKAA